MNNLELIAIPEEQNKFFKLQILFWFFKNVFFTNFFRTLGDDQRFYTKT